MVKLTDEEDRVRLRSYCSDHSYFLGGPLKWLVLGFQRCIAAPPSLCHSCLLLKICTAESRPMGEAQRTLPVEGKPQKIRGNTRRTAPQHINYNAGNVGVQRYISSTVSSFSLLDNDTATVILSKRSLSGLRHRTRNLARFQRYGEDDTVKLSLGRLLGSLEKSELARWEKRKN